MTIRLPVSNTSPGIYAKPQRASTTSTAGAVAAVAAPPSTFAPQRIRLTASSSTIAVNTRHAAPVAAPAKRSKDRSSTLASMWREIQGEGDWAGLVEPDLHPLLRAEIVRYGELVAATYKAFDLDSGSKRYLNCKYGRTRMLEEVGMAGAGDRKSVV